MRRRDFIKAVAGSAMTWPLAARAQQSEPMRRIGVLINVTADQPLGQSGLAVFQQGLQQLGWNDGRNVRFDIRWGENDVDRDRKDATELVSDMAASARDAFPWPEAARRGASYDDKVRSLFARSNGICGKLRERHGANSLTFWRHH
jgi:hypothetical protein